MHPIQQENETSVFHEFVHNRQQAFQRAFELVRRYLNEKQKRQNAIYRKKNNGPTYKDGQEVLLYQTTIAIGTNSNLASPWKGPYIIQKALNNVTFKIRGENSLKQQNVHYDRLKPVFEPPPTSNVPTRNKPRIFQSTQHIADTYEHVDWTLSYHDCFRFLPIPFSVFTPIPAVGRTTVPASRIAPITPSAPANREVTRSPPVFS